MSSERPTFSEVGEENIRQYLRRRCEEHTERGSGKRLWNVNYKDWCARHGDDS